MQAYNVVLSVLFQRSAATQAGSADRVRWLTSWRWDAFSRVSRAQTRHLGKDFKFQQKSAHLVSNMCAVLFKLEVWENSRYITKQSSRKLGIKSCLNSLLSERLFYWIHYYKIFFFFLLDLSGRLHSSSMTHSGFFGNGFSFMTMPGFEPEASAM